MIEGATARQSSASPLPARIVVVGGTAAVRAAFAAVAPLQPIAWLPDGLLCSPRASADAANEALERCPLPIRVVEGPPLFPTPPSAWIGGWYRRSPDHAPAPAGVPELVQVDGEGFGLGDHATTEMCLEALPELPDGPAVDVGCGSGMLAQAWAASGRGPVLAVDLDPRAVSQTRASAEAAGHAERVRCRTCPAERLDADDVEGRVVLANMPQAAHRALLERLAGVAIRGAVISGLRAGEGEEIARGYAARGLRERRVARRSGWECRTLVGP